MTTTSPRPSEPCGSPAPGSGPGRKGFSLTRARPSRERLTRADRRRAAIFSTAVGSVLWALEKTIRHRSVGEAAIPSYRRLGPGNLLFALLHGDHFPIFSYARDADICVIVSRSPDGEILARLLTGRGYCVVRGSNTRGATRAMIDMARVMDKGHDAAIAVDGPRGPADKVKPGIILLAKVTGCPIVPLGAGISRCKQFASWDRFKLPLPFSRTAITVGESIQVPPDASAELVEQKRQELEQVLGDLRHQARDLAREHFSRADRPPGFAASRVPADGRGLQ